MFQPDEGRFWLGMVLKDSEKIFDIAYTNSIIGTVILLTKKKIYKNRQCRQDRGAGHGYPTDAGENLHS